MSRGGKRRGAGRPANKPIVLNIKVNPVHLRVLQAYFQPDEETMIAELTKMVEQDVRRFVNVIRNMGEIMNGPNAFNEGQHDP